MLIDKFHVPFEEVEELGLEQIEMTRLGKFVALTGANGAGKTRVLNKLIECTNFRNANIKNVSQHKDAIKAHSEAIKNNPSDTINIPQWQSVVNEHTKIVELVLERVFTSSDEQINPIPFVPKKLGLVDARQYNKIELMSHYNAAKNIGINGFEHYCFAHITQVQTRDWIASHQLSEHSDSDKTSAKEDYQTLCQLIETLLKAKLQRSIDNDATLFNKPLADAGLSDGQKVLIQLAVALHSQKNTLKNSIFIMDEPENHLHPSALIEFLDALSKTAENSQFWIATHSVPLLAYIAQIEPNSIWYVEKGKVSNAGTNPLKVLKGLLGDDNQIAALNNFTSLPAQLAALQHATECLFPPKVLGNGKEDPQIDQINNLLISNEKNDKISILDFGAGKSRLLSGLQELAVSQGKNLKDRIEYFAYDKFSYDKEISQGVISEIYGNDFVRHVSTREEFFTHKDSESIDVVVMCNVLHEIEPCEWLNIFDNQSLVYRALKETGCILIVEDQRIPVGEKAHQFGFIVFDTPHLKTLFGVEQTDIEKGLFRMSDYREDGRLKAHYISKTLLPRLTNISRKKAIEELIASSVENIISCRNQAPSYKTGQLHSFWTQQFANASLYLKQI